MLELRGPISPFKRMIDTKPWVDRENGITVLMRYTLRLLTLQQSQRAPTLIRACGEIHRIALNNGDSRWGKTPYRLGLWVGGSTGRMIRTKR
jgi:hypothetical protein